MVAVEIRFAWITAQDDRTEHAVPDDAQNAARSAGGRFEPICGERFLAADMTVGPLETCTTCWAFLRARTCMRSLDERMNQRNWLSRLCHRKQPAGVGSETTTTPDAPTSAGTHESSAGAVGAPERKQQCLSVPAPAGARHRRRDGGRHPG